jgi:tetratricopeptide (TPR) repeat protein
VQAATALRRVTRLSRQQGQPAELVEQALLAAVKGHPASPVAEEARRQLAALYYRAARESEGKDDWEGAIAAWSKALEFDADDTHRVETILRIADGLINQQRAQDALPYLRQLQADARPEFRTYKEEAEWLEAAVYYQAGERDKTITILRRIAASPNHSQRQAAQDFLERLGEAG